MDQPPNSESVPPEKRYQYLQQEAQTFSTDLAQLTTGQPTNEAMHQMVQRGMKLDGGFGSLMNSVKTEELNQAFPDRRNLHRAIADSLIKALDKLPYNELSTEEM